MHDSHNFFTSEWIIKTGLSYNAANCYQRVVLVRWIIQIAKNVLLYIDLGLKQCDKIKHKNNRCDWIQIIHFKSLLFSVHYNAFPHNSDSRPVKSV